MPKSPSSSIGKPEQPKFTFVNYDLTKDDKKDLAGVQPQASEVFSAITSLVKEGYKFSVAWDDYSDCVACWLIGQAKSLPNYGFILTSRASTLERACVALIYKHKSVFDGIWHDKAGDGRPTDDW